MGQCEQAEPLLISGYDGLESALSGQHRETLGAVDALISLYDAWGKPRDADTWRSRRIK